MLFDVAVVVPTYNRVGLLRKCLEGLARQDSGDINFQVLVVDNGDIAGASCVERAVFESPKRLNAKYLRTDPPGVSRARNRGIENASAPVVAFLDDDEIPAEEWLRELVAPFSRAEPKVSIVCGALEPIWEVPRPSWLEDRYLGFFSAGFGPAGNKWSQEPRVMQANEWIAEGNCAVRTELLRSHKGFNESLGRAGDSLISGENAIFEEMRQAGATAFFSPSAVVKHLIPERRLTKQWLAQRAFAHGITKAMTSENMPIPNVSVSLPAIVSMDVESLLGEELLMAIQLFEIFGFICHRKELL